MKGAIFDLDGLLVDTEKTYRDGWLWGFQQYDLAIPKEVVDAWGGKNWKQSFDILVKAAGSPEKVQPGKSCNHRDGFFRAGGTAPKL